jgi:hypothetical protein
MSSDNASSVTESYSGESDESDESSSNRSSQSRGETRVAVASIFNFEKISPLFEYNIQLINLLKSVIKKTKMCTDIFVTDLNLNLMIVGGKEVLHPNGEVYDNYIDNIHKLNNEYSIMITKEIKEGTAHVINAPTDEETIGMILDSIESYLKVLTRPDIILLYHNGNDVYFTNDINIMSILILLKLMCIFIFIFQKLIREPFQSYYSKNYFSDICLEKKRYLRNIVIKINLEYSKRIFKLIEKKFSKSGFDFTPFLEEGHFLHAYKKYFEHPDMKGFDYVVYSLPPPIYSLSPPTKKRKVSSLSGGNKSKKNKLNETKKSRKYNSKKLKLKLKSKSRKHKK